MLFNFLFYLMLQLVRREGFGAFSRFIGCSLLAPIARHALLIRRAAIVSGRPPARGSISLTIFRNILSEVEGLSLRTTIVALAFPFIGRRFRQKILARSHQLSLYWWTLSSNPRTYSSKLVPRGGVEPPKPYGHSALNAACLPISPSRHHI